MAKTVKIPEAVKNTAIAFVKAHPVECWLASEREYEHAFGPFLYAWTIGAGKGDFGWYSGDKDPKYRVLVKWVDASYNYESWDEWEEPDDVDHFNYDSAKSAAMMALMRKQAEKLLTGKLFTDWLYSHRRLAVMIMKSAIFPMDDADDTALDGSRIETNLDGMYRTMAATLYDTIEKYLFPAEGGN